MVKNLEARSNINVILKRAIAFTLNYHPEVNENNSHKQWYDKKP